MSTEARKLCRDWRSSGIYKLNCAALHFINKHTFSTSRNAALMGGIESLNNKLCKCQCSFLRRNSFQLTKRQQDHQQMRVLCAWHKHGETEVSSLKIYPCISPTVQSLFLCSYPNQSQPAQHAQTAPLSQISRFTPHSSTSKPRTQRGTI